MGRKGQEEPVSAITWWSRFNEGKTFPAQHSHAGITNPDDRCCVNATLHVLLYSHEDYLRQLGCSARGRWHTAICTLRQNILRAPGVVDSDALVQLLLDVKEGKSPLRRDPNSNRKLEQADAMELRDHIMSKLVKEANDIGVTPPQCNLKLRCTNICSREHESGVDAKPMALHLQQASYDSMISGIMDLFKAKVVTDHKCSHPVCHTCKSTIKEDAKRCPDCRRQLGRCGAAMWELTQPLGFPEVLCVDISRAVHSKGRNSVRDDRAVPFERSLSFTDCNWGAHHLTPDTPLEWEAQAAIIHIGHSTTHGHYVAMLIHNTHVEVLNDDKVTCYSLDALHHPGVHRNVTSVMYVPVKGTSQQNPPRRAAIPAADRVPQNSINTGWTESAEAPTSDVPQAEPVTPAVRDVNAGAPFGLHRATSDSSSASRATQDGAPAQPASPAAARGGPGFQWEPTASEGSAPSPPLEWQQPSRRPQRGSRRAAPDRIFEATTGRPSAAQGPPPGSSCGSGGSSGPTAAARGAPGAGPGVAAAASGRSTGPSAKPQGKGRTGPTTRPTDSKTGGHRRPAPASGGRQAQAERAQQADLLNLAAEKQRRAVLIDQEKAEQQERSAGDRRSSNSRAADPAVQAPGGGPQQPVTKDGAAGFTPAKQPTATAPRQQAMPAAAEARPDPEDSRQRAKDKKAAKAAREARARMAKVQERRQVAAAALKAAQEAEAAAAAARAEEETHSAAAEATAAAEAAQKGRGEATPQPPVHPCALEAAQEGNVAAEQAQVDITAEAHEHKATAQAQPVAAASTAAPEPEGRAVPQAGQQPAAAEAQRKSASAAAASPAGGGTQPAAAMAELAADAAGAAHGQQLNAAGAQQAAGEGKSQAKGLEGQGRPSGSAQQAPAKGLVGQTRKAAQRTADAAAAVAPAGDSQQPAAARAELPAGAAGHGGQPAAAAAQQAAEEGLPQAKGLDGQGPPSGSAQQAPAEHPRCGAKKAARQKGAGAIAAVDTPAGHRQQPAAAKAELPPGGAAHPGGQPAAAAAQQAAEEGLPQAEGLEGQAPVSEGTRQAAAEDRRCRAEGAARQQVVEQPSRGRAAAEAPEDGRTGVAARAAGVEASRQSGHAPRKTKPRSKAQGSGEAAQTEEHNAKLDRWGLGRLGRCLSAATNFVRQHPAECAAVAGAACIAVLAARRHR